VPREQRAQRAGAGREPRPDETRMMRTQPREQVRPAREPARSRPVPPPVAPPVDQPGGRPRGRTRGRRRPRVGRIVLGLLALWVVFLVVVPFLAWNNVEKVSWEPEGERPAEQPGTTYLLVGSDSRAGLTAAERRRYSTGNPEANLADTIMLLHTGSGPNVLLSIPRDSNVDIPGVGTSKINGAYSRGGPALLTQTVEQNTGVRIDSYVQIGLGGVAQVVDAVGGVDVCPEYRMRDEDAGLNIKKGCQEVDGQVALAYSRSRKAQRNGDLDRVKHQREVVAAIGSKVLTPWTVVNPLRWWRLNNAMPDFFTFGEGMGMTGAGRWALGMSQTSGGDGRTCTMPVTDGSATEWDAERAEPLLAAIIDDQTDKITAEQCTPAGIVGAQ
jgi:LCP family protein required for cell wall assembly